MDHLDGKEELGRDHWGALPDSLYETGVENCRRVIREKVALNDRLWMKVEMADRIKVQVAEALYNGRLEIIAVEDEPLTATMKRLRAYVQARACLKGLTRQQRAAELERPAGSSLEPSALFPILVEAAKSVTDENQLLAPVAMEGDRLRSDPLSLVLWLEQAEEP